MGYRCQVCRKHARTAPNLANHVMERLDPDHVDWIDSNGLNIKELVGTLDTKGQYRALIELIERTCRVEE